MEHIKENRKRLEESIAADRKSSTVDFTQRCHCVSIFVHGTIFSLISGSMQCRPGTHQL